MNETEKVVAPSGKPLPSQVINAVRLGISRAEVQSIRVVDTDLVVILKNGKRIVIPDGAIKAMMDPAFTVAFKDTDVLGMSVIQSAGPLEINSISAASLSEAGNTPNTAVKGSEQDTTTGLTTGSAEVTPAVETKSSDATTAASRTLADMQADATSRNQISEPVSRGVTGRGLGGTPENSFNPSANSGVVSTVAEAAKTGGMFSFLDGLPPALGAVGALGALGALGATAGTTAAATAATPTVVMDPTYTISGVVALGPFVQSVTIKAYDASGTLLYSGNSDTSGRFNAKITSGYKGAILLLASDSNGTVADYIDEASGTSKSLGSSLIRSASVADGTQNVVVNVSPLTELVVRALGLSIDGISLANVTTAAITNANKTIGQQFGLSDASSDPIETVISSQGVSVAGNQYGKVLSAFSGLDNLSSSKELLSGLSSNIVSAAAAVANNITPNSSSALSDAVAAVTKVNGAPVLSLVSALKVSEVANLNFTSPDMKVKVAYVWIASGDVVQFYDASGAKVHAAHTVTLAESQAGYIELTISAADFTKAVGNRSQSLKVSVLNAISSEVLSETSLPVLVDHVVPLAPVISASASQQNASAAAAGALSITAEAGASVVVTFTDAGTRTVTKTITGTGSTPVLVALTVAELATLSSEGAISVSARATDAIGNVSSAGTGSFTLDRIAPVTPTVTATTSAQNADIATAGAVNVTAEAGVRVAVTFTDAGNHTVTKTVTGNGSTLVVVALTVAELALLSSEGTVTVSAKAIDAAGNESASSSSFTLDHMVFTSVTSGVSDPTPADARTNQASGTVVFNYTGADLVLANGEKFQYSLDNVNWADVSSVNTATNTVSVAGLSLTSSPTVRIRATDSWGSTTAVLAQQTITYDNVVATPTLPILPSTATDLTDSATGWLGSLNAPFNVSNGTANLTRNNVAGNKYVTTPLLTMLPGQTYTVQFEVLTGTTTPGFFGLTQTAGGIASYNLPLGTQLPLYYSGITAGLYTVSVTNPFSNSNVYLSWGTYNASGTDTWTFDNVALSSGRYALAVQGLESGATWRYSLNSGTTWLAGTGSSIDLPSGSTYNASTIIVEQTDLAGNVSTQAVNDKAITVTRALLTLSTDDGTALDNVSTQGAITLGNLISTGATWEYTTNTGTTWVAGTGTSFTLANGEYLANTVQVRQTLGSLTTIVAANTTSAIRINANASLLLAELKAGGFNIVGATANEAMGNSVASAGDVNGDGLADVILGASLSDNNGTDAGRAYVVFGSTISNVALSAAALSTRGFIIEGESAGNNAGISVSSAGDINGDGLADLLVGANNANSTGTNKSGRTYVVYGKTNNDTVQLASVAGGTGGFVVNGDGASQYTGWSVHSAGDVNGDGWSDLVIGARNWKDTVTNSTNIGRSFVVFGGPSMASVNLTTITAGTGGFVIAGELANDQSGYSVASAGDVNGDGLADLIVSAPFADVAGPLVDAGRSYVVFGKTSTQTVNLGAVATGTGGFVINGQGASDESGYTVSAAGDVNGDGLADLIVGAWKSDPNGVLNAGRSYVVFGQTGTAAVNLSAVAAATGGFVINGSLASEQSVFSVSYAGDFNGDGLADLLVGARQNASVSSAYVAYLVLGKGGTTAVQLSDVARGVGGFGMSVPNSWDSAGTIVSAGGDINGDGLADLIVSAPLMDSNGADAGRTYVVFGNTTGINSLSAVDGIGTTGNDTITSTGSQTLVGNAGIDTFTASGADVLRGGLGNDIFTIGLSTATALQSAFGVGGNTSQLAQIDGGAGVDTLRLSSGISLDLTLVANQAGSTPEGGSRISSIERIDMATDTSTNTLKLGLNDVLDMAGMNLFTTANGWTNATSTPLATTNARHQLVVDGTTADTVQIVGGASWTLAGTATSSVSGSSQTYNVWNHNSAAAQMLIDTDINRAVL